MNSILEDKIQSVLNILDITMQTYGNQYQYQERLYRIYKTLLSITKHSEAVVSSFDDEKDNTLLQGEENTLSSNNKNNSFQSEYLLEKEKELTASANEISRLLLLLESKSAQANDAKDYELYHNTLRNKLMKIELMLKSYVEEKKISVSNRHSQSCKSSSIKNKTSSPLPNVVGNFFNDREALKKELANTHKRYSAFNIDSNNQLSNESNKEYIINSSSFKKRYPICNSEVIQLKTPLNSNKEEEHKIINTEVSNFNLNLSQNQEELDYKEQCNEGLSVFKITKRNSLFTKNENQNLNESKRFNTLFEENEEDN